MFGEKIDHAAVFVEDGCRDFELWNSLEHREEHLLGKGGKVFCGTFAEEDFGGVDGCVIVLLRVYTHREVLGEGFLQDAQVRFGIVLTLHFLDFLFGEVSEDADVSFAVVVGTVEPELVEGVWGGAGGVEPDVALLGFAEFAAVGLGYERTGECIGLAVDHAADEFRAGGDVAPLVGSAHLHLAVLSLV